DPNDCPQPTGACCFANGSCIVAGVANCTGAGGVYQGNGTDCNPNECPQPTGACCFADGSCQLLTAAECLDQGGNYEGNDTTCDPNLCPEPAGACCFPDGSCIEVREENCETAAGGVYQGDGTTCDPNDCPQPTGACCLADGSCAVLTATECGNQGGDYQGDDTVCDPNDCPQPTGACCFDDGSCAELTEAACGDQGGDYQGGGTGCAPNDCPQPTGACCLPNGACVDPVTQADCVTALGGVYQGDDSSCDAAECPAPIGACCLPDGTCVELTPVECADLGGLYLGDDSRCDLDPCNERPHPGWNWVDNLIELTKNEPTFWSARSGMPKGVSPFEVLDPPGPGGPGRPDPDGSTDRVLRGYIIAYALDADGEEIRWNHLKGDVTIVNYRDSTAWEYNAYTFAVVAPVANGEKTGTPGLLNLDGAEYVPAFDQLLLDFQSSGSMGFSGPMNIVADTDLTLLPVDVDLRQETDGPVTTKAAFTIWNQNEVKFSGLDRCITCWDQALVSRYDLPNHFLRENLQTDKGKARINGLQSMLCPGSQDAAMLGVAAKHLGFGPGLTRATAGTNLHGLGLQSATIKVDVLGGPPRATDQDDVEQLLEDLARTALLSGRSPQSKRTTDEGGAAGGGAAGPDRVSMGEKGSLLIFPKIELRWDAQGRFIQDTFVDIANDYPEDVRVQMFFINGDAPLP
ncbi:MAG: hypothetical protein ACYTJ0_17220, partial [Planctomycetota bacterium]